MSETATLERDDLTLRIEKTLSHSLGGNVRIGAMEQISLRGRQTDLYRFPLTDAPANAPETLVMKRAEPENYRPDDPDSWAAQSHFGEWAGLEFLSRHNVAGCPRYYGGDREMGFVLMEDLGKIRDVADILLNGTAPEAEDALVLLMKTVGQMHAATCGRADEYRGIRAALGPGEGWIQTPQRTRDQVERLLKQFDKLGLKAHPNFVEESDSLGRALAEPGPFLAYTHGDPCPDNLAVVENGLRLFDFAVGAMRHALTDGVYGWIRFPTCWCVRDIPENVLIRMDAAYRAELVAGCPMAEDDGQYRRAVAEGCGYWIPGFLSWTLEACSEFDHVRGPSTQRQRVMKRLGAFVRAAEEGKCYPALRETYHALLNHLSREWRNDMRYYPAFYVPRLPEPTEITELMAAIRENAIGRVGEMVRANPALVHARPTDGEAFSPLSEAVRLDLREMAELLFERGADVDGHPGAGKALLFHALESASPEMTESLVRHGAELNRRYDGGRLPIHEAIEHHPERLSHLRGLGAKLDLIAAIWLNLPETAEEILTKDPSQVNGRISPGWSPLHVAAKEGNRDLASLLLKHGARTDAKTYDGKTPAELADENGHADLATFIREWKAEG